MSARTTLAALLLTLILPAPAMAAGSWVWPVRGEVLTAFRNGSDPYAAGQHRGIDIASPVGTDVVAATGGTVRHAAVAGDSGLTVSVRAGDFDLSYLHLSAVAVKAGQSVAAGARIGSVGTSGRRSAEQPHLHFGVRRAGDRHAYLDPLDFLTPPPAAPRESPRGAPVPVPVTPRPEPAPVRGRAPLRVPVGRRVRVPAARRVRVPAGRRVRAPRLGPAPRSVAPRAVPLPGGEGVPALRPVPSVRRHVRPGRAPQEGPRPVHLGEPGKARAARPARTPQPAAGSAARGPDFGWALACLGLLAAAACLGRPGRGKGGTGTADAGAKLRALLRPLTGGPR
jgi:hypothetical protein